MKYKYTVKIHTVNDYFDLEKVMNEYGKDSIRVIKAEFVSDLFENGRPMKKFVLFLEKKIKKI